ncbi:uncharacterized protein [Hyperolius riggenbachi]|uniref:uncharacterized protein n=1 Tax=Hyperolius riggenbachi TaxID=752182 RepID=UPI0035A2C578
MQRPIVRGKATDVTGRLASQLETEIKNRNQQSLMPPQKNLFDGTLAQDVPVGARLKTFSNIWRSKINSQWVIKTISEGHSWAFKKTPINSFTPTKVPQTVEKRTILYSYLEELIHKQAVLPVPLHQKGLGFYSPMFLVKKKTGKLSACTRLKETESLHPVRQFQNGISSIDHSSDKRRRLVSFSRPGRCLSPYSHPTKHATISQVQHRGQTLPIQMPTLRDINRTKDFYKSVSFSCGSSKNTGSASVPLPGRPVTDSGQQTSPVTAQRNPPSDSERLRMADQHPQEPIRSNARLSLSWSSFSDFQERDIDTSGQDSDYPKQDTGHDSHAILYSQEMSQVNRDLISNDTNATLVSLPYTSIPDRFPCSMEQVGYESEDLHLTVNEDGSTMVVMSRQNTWSPSDHSEASCCSHNRCQREGLGGNLRIPGSSGSLEFENLETVIESSRVISGSICPSPFPEVNFQQELSSESRQQHDSIIHSETGGHTQSISPEGSGRDFSLCGEQSLNSESGVYTGQIECGSRFSESDFIRQQRMVTEPIFIRSDLPEVGVSRDRPDGVWDEQQMQKVYGEVPISKCRGIRCHNIVMEFLDGVCVSPSAIDLQPTQETLARICHTPSGDSELAAETLVSVASPISNGRPSNPPLQQTPPNPRSSVTSKSSTIELSGMEVERRKLQSLGCTPEVIETLLKARKPSTNASYYRIWNRFTEFALSSSFDPLHPSPQYLLAFLQTGLQKGLSYNALKVQISAISALTDQRWALHPLIKQFMLAAIKIRPPRKAIFPKWDLPLVLNYLSAAPFEPMEECSLWHLTLKACFLVAITSARRVSELQALSCREPFLSFFNDRVQLRPMDSFLPKVTKTFHINQEWSLPAFHSEENNTLHSLDVSRVLKAYITATEEIRKSDHLFLVPSGYRKGHGASSRTIASWLIKAIQGAYRAINVEPPDGIRAHSTRGMASSWAAYSNVSASKICQAANWSSINTFISHYKVDVSASTLVQFGRAVISSSILNME